MPIFPLDLSLSDAEVTKLLDDARTSGSASLVFQFEKSDLSFLDDQTTLTKEGEEGASSSTTPVVLSPTPLESPVIRLVNSVLQGLLGIYRSGRLQQITLVDVSSPSCLRRALLEIVCKQLHKMGRLVSIELQVPHQAAASILDWLPQSIVVTLNGEAFLDTRVQPLQVGDIFLKRQSPTDPFHFPSLTIKNSQLQMPFISNKEKELEQLGKQLNDQQISYDDRLQILQNFIENFFQQNSTPNPLKNVFASIITVVSRTALQEKNKKFDELITRSASVFPSMARKSLQQLAQLLPNTPIILALNLSFDEIVDSIILENLELLITLMVQGRPAPNATFTINLVGMAEYNMLLLLTKLPPALAAFNEKITWQVDGQQVEYQSFEPWSLCVTHIANWKTELADRPPSHLNTPLALDDASSPPTKLDALLQELLACSPWQKGPEHGALFLNDLCILLHQKFHAIPDPSKPHRHITRVRREIKNRVINIVKNLLLDNTFPEEMKPDLIFSLDPAILLHMISQKMILALPIRFINYILMLRGSIAEAHQTSIEEGFYFSREENEFLTLFLSPSCQNLQDFILALLDETPCADQDGSVKTSSKALSMPSFAGNIFTSSLMPLDFPAILLAAILQGDFSSEFCQRIGAKKNAQVILADFIETIDDPAEKEKYLIAALSIDHPLAHLFLAKEQDSDISPGANTALGRLVQMTADILLQYEENEKKLNHLCKTLLTSCAPNILRAIQEKTPEINIYQRGYSTFKHLLGESNPGVHHLILTRPRRDSLTTQVGEASGSKSSSPKRVHFFLPEGELTTLSGTTLLLDTSELTKTQQLATILMHAYCDELAEEATHVVFDWLVKKGLPLSLSYCAALGKALPSLREDIATRIIDAPGSDSAKARLAFNALNCKDPVGHFLHARQENKKNKVNARPALEDFFIQCLTKLHQIGKTHELQKLCYGLLYVIQLDYDLKQADGLKNQLITRLKKCSIFVEEYAQAHTSSNEEGSSSTSSHSSGPTTPAAGSPTGLPASLTFIAGASGLLAPPPAVSASASSRSNTPSDGVSPHPIDDEKNIKTPLGASPENGGDFTPKLDGSK